jgi:hypothetical protein
MLNKYDELIYEIDGEIEYTNLKRALLFILSQCVYRLDLKTIKENDKVELPSNNITFKIYLKLRSINEFDKYKVYNFELRCKYGNNDILLLYNNYYQINTSIDPAGCSVDIDFSILSNNYDNYTPQERSMTRLILHNYINSTEDENYKIKSQDDLYQSMMMKIINFEG